MKHLYLPALGICCLFSMNCSPEQSPASQSAAEKAAPAVTNNTRQLNINILVDLSDRINPKKSAEKPSHSERDLKIISYITDYFAKDMELKKSFHFKGKIRINFYPRPKDPDINTLAETLNIDASKMDVMQKKEIHDNISQRFTSAMQKIYISTIRENRWNGSDIWRFFKNDVKDYCVESSPEYRNILIILTDGYIYHDDSKMNLGNRYSYIVSSLFNKHKLRNNPGWEEEIKKQDFGLIAKRNDLNNLEVLTLEITPSPENKDDEDIIKTVLGKWFSEMKVKRSAIYNSDLPEYTRQRVMNFLMNE